MSVTVPSDMRERVRFAEETHRMALDLWDYVFPPWRWLEWHRRYKLIRARSNALQAANAETRAKL